LDVKVSRQFEEKNIRKSPRLAATPEGNGDPRPDFLAELKSVLGDHGNIVVYSQSFEKGVLAELGKAFPRYAA